VPAVKRVQHLLHLVSCCLQICAGVGHMHSRGYAHMDIKPHNVLIKRPASQQQQMGPSSTPRLGSRPRIRATAMPDSDEETDVESGTSLVSRC
jgi:serine/threonine protein kinase